MAYSVKEIFYTLQGEGANTGKPAVFCRFAGCNLWSGHEQDRETAICKFCDTDFVGTDGTMGGKFGTADALAERVLQAWPAANSIGVRLVVLTGGEPLLQVDIPLIQALHERNFVIAVETNGTITAPPGLDWICVSPKAGAQLLLKQGNELKVVIPQPGLDLSELGALPFTHHYVQPMDGPDLGANTQQAINWCLANPGWRLSIQTHKMIGTR